MAFAAADLRLLDGYPGAGALYTYESSDAMATIIAAGYFNNTDDSLNLTVGDKILVDATSGEALLEVASISSGSVTTRVVRAATSVQDLTGTAGTASTITADGFTHVGGTADRTYAVANPYAGARKTIFVSEVGTGKTMTLDLGTTATVELGTLGTGGDITAALDGIVIELYGMSATLWRGFQVGGAAVAN